MSPRIRQYKRRTEDREPIHPWRWRVLWGWMLIFTAVVIWLVVSNRHRINDIQHSRVLSCERTYENVEDVALFFFPPAAKRDLRQRTLVTDLHTFLLKRIETCKDQVKAP